ncbi:MAG: glutamate ligase domain-containing protein, partial [Marinilabiliaceae bacterium]
REVLLKIFGPHNLQNLAGALEVARKLGISAGDFLEAMRTFEGADRRLQVLGENSGAKVFFDFAHAPSKVRASVAAVKAQYPSRKLVAVVELHTFSSLSREFLPQYRHAMDDADEAIVFFSPEVVAHKKLPSITAQEVADAFGHSSMRVFDDAECFKQHLQSLQLKNANLLLMTSGNLAGIDVHGLTEKLL